MKVESNGGTVFEVGSDELEAVSQTADAVATLADTVLGSGGSATASAAGATTTGTCESCGGSNRVLRDVAGAAPDGSVQRVSVCAECQDGMVGDKVSASGGGQHGGAPELDASDIPDDVDFDRLPPRVTSKDDVAQLVSQSDMTVDDLPREDEGDASA